MTIRTAAIALSLALALGACSHTADNAPIVVAEFQAPYDAVGACAHQVLDRRYGHGVQFADLRARRTARITAETTVVSLTVASTIRSADITVIGTSDASSRLEYRAFVNTGAAPAYAQRVVDDIRACVATAR